MRSGQRLIRCLQPGLVALLLSGAAGCALLNSFLDPTAVGQFPLEYQEGGVRRILTPRDAPWGPPGATEPTPEDLVAYYEEYRLVPGDVLNIQINDLVDPGRPELAQLEVSPTGNIRIPLLGSVKVSGMTEQEVEEELKARLREAQLLSNPDVRVAAATKRKRTFTVRGAVGAAGQYVIAEPDTRLLDVIGLARDIGPNVPKLYVIRRVEAGRGAAGPAAPPAPKEPAQRWVVPPPEEEPTPVSFSTNVGLGRAQPPSTETSSPWRTGQQQEREEMEAVIAPSRPGEPATQEAAPAPEPPFEPLIFDPRTGELLPPPTPTAEQAQPAEPVEKPFEWEAVPELELEQRVIEIDTRALLSGDPRYNIVIRDRDVINVPIDTGVYYLMGEVARPGAYAFNGRDVTIKQALAAAGGFAPLAWPQRCEIIRHEPGTDKQITIPVNLDAIYAGLEADVYLRDNDIVNVGTHVIAPFLFVVRNSFRFTYGFGFVYDRNFADKDAYSARLNPETKRMYERQQRGLPF